MCGPCRNLVVAMAKRRKLDASAYKVELREPAFRGRKHDFQVLCNIRGKAELEAYNNKLDEEHQHELVETKAMWDEDERPYMMKWWYEQSEPWRNARWRPKTRYNVGKTVCEPKPVKPQLKACTFCKQDPPDHYGPDCPNYRRKPCRFCGITNPDHKGPECPNYVRRTCRHCGMTNPDHKGPDCEKHPKVIQRKLQKEQRKEANCKTKH